MVRAENSKAVQNSAPTCDEVLTACDKALNDQININENINRQLELYKRLDTENVVEISRLRGQVDTFYWKLGLAILGGMVTGAILAK